MKTGKKLILYGSVILLLVPAILSSIWPDMTVSQNENRNVEGFPPFPSSLDELKQWPSRCDAFLQDHFFKRSVIIHYTCKFLKTCFSISTNKNVIIGKNDWLYLTNVDHTMERYRGLYTFTDENQKQKWIDRLNQLAQSTRQTGADFVFVILPEKATVYPEYLPAKYTVIGPNVTDTIVDILKKQADFTWIDVRPAIIEAGRTERLYYQADTHMNKRGGYLAYTEIARQLEKQYPIAFVNPSRLSFIYREKIGGDLARMLGLNEDYHETVPLPKIEGSIVTSTTEGSFKDTYVTIKTSDSKLPKALMYCDSFTMHCLLDYLQESFSESSYKHHYHFRSFDKKFIQTYKPDIVFVIMTERLIPLEINVK